MAESEKIMKNGEMITINCKRFVIKNNLEVSDAIAWDIDDAYERPSYTKINIWNEWDRWAQEIHEIGDPENCCTIWITGKNMSQFTIGGSCSIDGKNYKFKITKEHSYIKEI